MSKFESSAAPLLPKKDKPKLIAIEGGKGKSKAPEHWSVEELMKPNAPKPKAHGVEAPIDIAAVMREDHEKVEDIRAKISKINMPAPKPQPWGSAVDRWSTEEVLKPNMPRPRQHGAEAPVDIAAIMRSDAELEAAATQPRKKVRIEDLPEPTGKGKAGERWSIKEVLKPNMPRPRQHGAEAPVDIAAIMRSDAELEAAAPEKPKIVMPRPSGMDEPIELSEEDFEEVIEEAPPSKSPPRRRPPPPPQYREAA